MDAGNPFDYAFAVPPDKLIGRNRQITQILRGVTAKQPISYELTAFRGFGKSALLSYIGDEDKIEADLDKLDLEALPFAKLDRLVFIYVDCSLFPVNWKAHSAANNLFSNWFWHEVRGKLLASLQSETVEPDEELLAIANLQRVLADAHNAEKRAVFLLDHFDKAFSAIDVGEAQQLRPLVTLASFVFASERPLNTLEPEVYGSWLGDSAIPIRLNPLTKDQADELITDVLNNWKDRSNENMIQSGAATEDEGAVEPYQGVVATGEQEAPKAASESIQKITKTDDPTTPKAPADPQSYKRIYSITGYYPPFILKGAAEWFNMLTELAAMNDKARLELLKVNLAERRFNGNFVHIWRLLSADQQWALKRLVTMDKEQEQDEKLRRHLETLRVRGVVEYASGRYKVFSESWEYFIKELPPQDAQQKKSDPGSQHLQSLEKEPDLTPTQKRLFEFLQRHQGMLCTYEDILDEVWNREDSQKGRRLLRETVRGLRDAIKQHGDIINLRDRGYEFRTLQVLPNGES